MAMYVGPRISALVLLAPFGLRSREHPTVDLLALPDEEVFPTLTENPGIMDGKMTMPPSPEFLADRYREATSMTRLYWERPYDLSLEKWLHRVTVPTRILWGEADRLLPVEQAPLWAELLPNATVKTFPGVGHLMFDESPEVVAAIGEFVRAPASAPAG